MFDDHPRSRTALNPKIRHIILLKKKILIPRKNVQFFVIRLYLAHGNWWKKKMIKLCDNVK